MDVRYSLMLTALSKHGWRVVNRQQKDLEWWADEIWTVESEWSPHGLTVFLTWLRDPEGHRVWAVGTCLQSPSSRDEAEGEPLMSINHWPRDLPEFLVGLQTLRDGHRAAE
jgi:hypothetical protein